MDDMDSKEIENDKRYFKSHKIEFVLIGLGVILGAVIGYHLWFIDFL